MHAALGDPARLEIVDTLLSGDASPSELAALLSMPSNLLAHHLQVLARAGVVSRRRSEGDGRRTYVRLERDRLEHLAAPPVPAPPRVLFVCTASSARSHLAAALWRRTSRIPTAAAGTHPAAHIHPGTVETAVRHDLPLPRIRPRHVDDVAASGDLLVTVCDRAHEELGGRSTLHWSVPDPVRPGTTSAFDAAYEELAGRVGALAGRIPV